VTFVYFSIGAWCGWMLAKIYYREYLPALAPPRTALTCSTGTARAESTRRSTDGN
jgi:hypothetical protein